MQITVLLCINFLKNNRINFFYFTGVATTKGCLLFFPVIKRVFGSLPSGGLYLSLVSATATTTALLFVVTTVAVATVSHSKSCKVGISSIA